MNVAGLLVQQARLRPGAPAIVEERRVTTFAELEAASAAFAERFRRAGLRRGDRVLVLVPMSALLYAVLVGIFRAGLVAVIVDPGAGREHMERCLARAPPDALVATPRAHLLRLVSPGVRRIPRKLWVARLPRGAAAGDVAEVASDEGALLSFTSGSTGTPKAALRSHGFLLAQHEVVTRHVRPAPGETHLVALPVFVLSNLAAGAASLVPPGDLRRPGRIDAPRVLRMLERHPCEVLGASPAFFERLVEARARLPHARRLLTGGGPVLPSLLRALQDAAPQAEVVALYGSTEAEPIAELRWSDVAPEDLAAMRAGSGLLVGAPVPETRVRVVDDEIQVAGPHVLPGYLDGVGDDDTKLREGGAVWHRTGDAGRFDARGRLWLLGRLAARIQDARGTLWPLALEVALADELGRCAVVAHRGKRVLVAARAPARRPEEVDEVVVAEVPLDPRHDSKVDLPALRRMLDALR